MGRKLVSVGTGANLGFEERHWAAADKLRGHMDAVEYKHVVLGLVFLKNISDAIQELHDAPAVDQDSAPEDRDEYLAEIVFWVPKVARWSALQANAKQPTIGKLIDDAMTAIVKDTWVPGSSRRDPQETRLPTGHAGPGHRYRAQAGGTSLRGMVGVKKTCKLFDVFSVLW
jgi:hypothetical protein